MSINNTSPETLSEELDFGYGTERSPLDVDQYSIGERLHDEPFAEIALSLSGGGYRAAAFHLGTLDILYRSGLLKSVRVLSTVSGGTFTGLKYAVSAAEGDSFEKFYRECYSFLAETNVIGRSLRGLQDERSPFSGQMPSLIRSAANVYASPHMFGDRTFDALLDNTSSHLKEISFNATEFRTGNYFRFQRSESAGAIIGNRNLPVKKPVARMIRLADIAAASSCFPSAFEPIRFPDDFLWPQTVEQVRSSLGEKFSQSIALMDGGIYDNQGVDSVLNVYNREGNKVGLVIISDTSQRNVSFFEFKAEKKRGWLTLNVIHKLSWSFFFIANATVVILILGALSSIRKTGFRFFDIFFYVIPIVLSSLVTAAFLWLQRYYKEGKERISEMTTLEVWPYLKHLTVTELIDLINGRLKSLVALTASVFMKRVRGLIYRDISVNEKYRGRHLSNLIYDLDDTGKFNDSIVAKLAPTEQMRQFAVLAEDVATSLWVKGPADLKNLVACGQATTSFNLLRYILEERANQLVLTDSLERGIYDQVNGLWQELKANPHSLVR